MSNEVYANGNEISCKACKGKTSSAFPDPCWSPPPPPTGPIIIPYPNLAKASSLKKGSKTVLIKGTMAALADQSYFSTSNGDEAATQAFQKGVLTRKIKGKAYYKKWSQNVKFEGKGVCRNFDLMTHNHGSSPGNTATFPFLAKAEPSKGITDPCAQEREKIEKECGHPDRDNATKAELKAWSWKDAHCKGILSKKTMEDAAVPAMLDSIEVAEGHAVDNKDQIFNRKDVADQQTKKADNNPCLIAKKCELISFNSSNNKNSKTKGCCGGQTGHHLIGDKMIEPNGCKSYSRGTAPTVCAEGVSHSVGSHGELHTNFSQLTKDKIITNQGKPLSRADAIDCAVQSHQMTFPKAGCQEQCIKAQLESYYSKCPDAEYHPVKKTGKKLSKEHIKQLFKEVDGLDSAP